MSPSGCATVEPHHGVAMCKRKRRRKEGMHKRKRRKREGEESLRDSGVDVCTASSRRWLEKRRRASAAVVRTQFPLTRLHGRPDLTKKVVPTERLAESSCYWTHSEQRGEKTG
jgi:hypothetical protein